MALITSGVYELELIEFLSVESLARLDSALTNKALRPFFLEWLRKVPIPQTMEWARKGKSGLRWLLRKHCKLPAIMNLGPDYGASKKDVHTMVEQNRNRIRVLNVAGLELTDACLSHIAECLSESLEAINIFDCEYITRTGIHALIDKCQLFKALEVNGCMGYYNFNADTSDFKALAKGRHFHQLEYLRAESRCFGDDALKIVGSACPSLRHIVIGCCENNIFTHRGLVALAKGCPLLETIQFYADHIRANDIDAVMNALATHCPQLRTLWIQEYNGSNAAAADLFEKCTNLQHIMFRHGSRLGDAVRSLAAVKGLKVLEIYNCPLVTAADVRLVVDAQIASLIYVSLKRRVPGDRLRQLADADDDLAAFCQQAIPEFDDGDEYGLRGSPPYDPIAFDRIYNARLSRAGKRCFTKPKPPVVPAVADAEGKDDKDVAGDDGGLGAVGDLQV